MFLKGSFQSITGSPMFHALYFVSCRVSTVFAYGDGQRGVPEADSKMTSCKQYEPGGLGTVCRPVPPTLPLFVWVMCPQCHVLPALCALKVCALKAWLFVRWVASSSSKVWYEKCPEMCSFPFSIARLYHFRCSSVFLSFESQALIISSFQL